MKLILTIILTLSSLISILPTQSFAKSTRDDIYLPIYYRDFGQNNINLINAFEEVKKESKFPIINRSESDINSAFGPRIQVSQNYRYDFHRGIDVGEEFGEQVVNAYEGQFMDIVYYEDGGTTVRVKHTFPSPLIFNGNEYNYFYTFYMHLDSVDPYLQEAFNNGQHPIIPTGQNIGTVGDSGSTNVPHLHFEVRVGTQCSLEYQLEHPDSSCAIGFGFDPHVNPLIMFNYNVSPVKLAILPSFYKKGTTTIAYATDDSNTSLNRVVVKIISNNTIIDTHVLDFDLRDGFDATSTEALDTQDFTHPYIDPKIFNKYSSSFTTNIVIPAVWVSALRDSNYSLEIQVFDIWGNRSLITTY